MNTEHGTRNTEHGTRNTEHGTLGWQSERQRGRIQNPEFRIFFEQKLAKEAKLRTILPSVICHLSCASPVIRFCQPSVQNPVFRVAYSVFTPSIICYLLFDSSGMRFAAGPF
jgi:hypothetical protein